MMRTMAASMAIERSSWITSIKVGVNTLLVLTFFVHFLKDWRGEYNPVDFANKRLIDPDDSIVPELLLGGRLLPSSRIIPHLEQVVPLENETLDILGARLIINYHEFFDLFDSQLVALQGFVVKEHDQGHLDGAQHEIVVSVLLVLLLVEVESPDRGRTEGRGRQFSHSGGGNAHRCPCLGGTPGACRASPL
jgi:hypothetical protein